MSVYGSPLQSPYGRAAQSKDPPDARLRTVLRKAFLEGVEGVLSEWDEASEQGMEVLRALVNAGDRLRDFSTAAGQLGVLSKMPGAEYTLCARLIRSMERLYKALRPQVAALAEACDKLEKVVNSTMLHVLELHAECAPECLWDSAYCGQPSIAEMEEWLQDCFHSLRRELALREQLMLDIGSDEGLNRAVELWDSQIWFDAEHTRARLDIVRIHGVTAT